MNLFQKAVCAQRRIELRRIRRFHLRERHAQRSRIVAKATHCRLDRNRVDLAEERVNEIGIGDLHTSRLCSIAIEIVLTDVMCRPRRDV